MRARILAFVQALRDNGMDVSVAEVLDAVAAVAAAGVEREVLREALAACLVKAEGDRPPFDALFEQMFPLGGRDDDGPGRRRRRASGGGAGERPGSTRRGSPAASSPSSIASAVASATTPQPVSGEDTSGSGNCSGGP